MPPTRTYRDDVAISFHLERQMLDALDELRKKRGLNRTRMLQALIAEALKQDKEHE